MREIISNVLLPDDWDELVPLSDADHRVFDLAESDLYNPDANMEHQRGALSGFIVPDAVLWPSTGAIRTRDGALIQDAFLHESCMTNAMGKGYLKRYRAVTCDGYAAELGHVYRNHYHKYADSLPRLYGLHHPDIASLERVTLYIDDRYTPEERTLIAGLVPQNVEIAEVPSAVRVEARYGLHLPFLSADRTNDSKYFEESLGFLPVEYLDWFRERFFSVMDVKAAQPHRRLFVTRRNAKVRRLLNEEEVASWLTGQGFEVVELENLSLRAQAKLFAEAEVVVGQHGAGLTNLLFARSPRVLEVLSDKDRQIYFSYLSRSRGFPHKQLCLDGADKNDDVHLPIAVLEQVLAELETA